MNSLDVLRWLGESAVIFILLQFFLLPALIARLRHTFSSELEKLRHEQSFARATYEQHLELILGYFGVVYRLYRVCQEAAAVDVKVSPDGSERHPKAEFLDRLDELKQTWDEQEGRIRLLLPSDLLELHERLVASLNAFRRAVKDFLDSEQQNELKDAIQQRFDELHSVKEEQEAALRALLRTEQLAQTIGSRRRSK